MSCNKCVSPAVKLCVDCCKDACETMEKSIQYLLDQHILDPGSLMILANVEIIDFLCLPIVLVIS